VSPRVLGVIPARAGSKRVKNKNLRMLCGKPLIAYTIEAAEKATKLTDWAVSTECANIAQVANLYGAYVIKRPEELATDEATTGSVLRHALDWMESEGNTYDMVVCLHPTSPIRDPKHIDWAIDRLWGSDRDTLASVCHLPVKRHHNLFDLGGDFIRGVNFFILNASIYALKRDWLIKHNKHVGDKPALFEMDRRHSLDIDEEIDLKIAELFLNGDIC
jgi:CMP-N,N'-diacetyllegionaminic acid synthase